MQLLGISVKVLIKVTSKNFPKSCFKVAKALNCQVQGFFQPQLSQEMKAWDS